MGLNFLRAIMANMKWIAITGSWRHSSPTLPKDLAKIVGQIIKNGQGLVTGGALGVDWLATELFLAKSKELNKLKIYLPTDVNTYLKHYRTRAREGVITKDQADKLIKQIKAIKKLNPKSIIEGPASIAINEASYYARNERVVAAADKLIAFHVNQSLGTAHAIDLAQKFGKKVKIFRYKTAKN